MNEIMDFLTSAKVTELAADPRVLAVAGVIFIAAVFLRSKFILLLLLGVGGVLAVLRYSNLGVQGGAPLDQQMLVFVGGILVVAVLLIYFLFIRGD